MKTLAHLFAVAIAAAQVLAQTVPVRTLLTPDAEFSGQFTQVAGVRELRDGRVIVLDKRERILKLVDMKTGKATDIGGHGAGPGEYQLPLRLLALPGDSSFINDMANTARPMVINPDGKAGDVLRGSQRPNGDGFFFNYEVASDGRGRLYRLGREFGAGSTVAIERLDRSTGKQDSVALVSRHVVSPLIPAAGNQKPPSGGAQRAAGEIAFTSVDQWAVALDGTVVVVSVEPYHVTFYPPSGARRVGPPIAMSRIAVTDAEKQMYRDSRPALAPALRMGSDGKMSATFMKIDHPEPDGWPPYLPSFLPDAVAVAPDGTVWVTRATAAGAPPSIDVIDGTGKLTSRVVLPKRSRLVGFGTNSIYVARMDDDDVEHLRRYPLSSKP